MPRREYGHLALRVERQQAFLADGQTERALGYRVGQSLGTDEVSGYTPLKRQSVSSTQTTPDKDYTLVYTCG